MATTGILTNPDVEVDVELVKATLSRYGIDLPKRASVKKIVSLLRNAYKERLDSVPEDEWIKCLVCGEITDDDEDLEACPYCGDDGAEEEEAEAAEEAGLDSDDDTEEDDDEPEPEEEDGDDDIEVEEPEKLEDDEDPEAGEKRKARHEKAEKAAKGDASDVIDVEESPEDDTTEEAPEVDLDSDEDEPEPDEDPDELEGEDEETGTSLVEADDDAPETLDASTPEGQLAVATQRAKVAQRNIAINGWDLGHILRDINERELWKAGGFSSFKDYYTKELGISKAFAYNMIDVAKKFSRKTFEEIGIKKLEIVARAPKESREKLLGEAGSSSKRDLEKKAREEKRKKKEKEKNAGKAAAPPPEPTTPTQAGGKRGRPSKEDQTITLLTKVGGRPKTYRFKDAQTHEEIPEWTKDAYVEVPLSDDVVLYIAPKTDRSGKKLTKLAVMYRKIEDGDDDGKK